MKKIFLIPLILTPIIVASTISTVALVSSHNEDNSKKEIEKVNLETKKSTSSSAMVAIIATAAVPATLILILIPIFIRLVKRKKEKIVSDYSDYDLEFEAPDKEEENEEIIKTIRETKKIDLDMTDTEEFNIDDDVIWIKPGFEKSKKSKGSIFRNIFKKEKNNVLKINPAKSKEVLEINKFGRKYSFETVLVNKASILVEQTMNLIDDFIMDNFDIKSIKDYKSIIATIHSIDTDEKNTITKGYKMCQEFLNSKNSNKSFLNKEWLDELNSISSKIVEITEKN